MSPEVLRALFLGALQGATEFLPVSSSGHLVIVPALLGWEPSSLTFDVTVHWATALALLVHFRSDWARLFRAGWLAVRRPSEPPAPEARLLVLLALATVPAMLAGLWAKDVFEDAFAANPGGMARLAAALLLVTGTMLLVSERLGHRVRRAEDIRTRGALGVGLAQAIAILPGISRSGATIAAGLGAGLERAEAARFGFLLGTPIILGAAFLELGGLAADGPAPGELRVLAAGFASALVVGHLSIGWLLRYLRRAPLTVFALYTWGAGLTALWLLR